MAPTDHPSRSLIQIFEWDGRDKATQTLHVGIVDAMRTQTVDRSEKLVGGRPPNSLQPSGGCGRS